MIDRSRSTRTAGSPIAIRRTTCGRSRRRLDAGTGTRAGRRPRCGRVRGVTGVDLVVLHEHPEWQKPLFAALRAARRRVRAVRPRGGGVQQRRGAARAALLQPSEPERVRPRPHPGGASGARLHADAGSPRRARAQRRRRVRPGVEQERAGDPAAHARHRYPAFDHLQRRSARCARYADTITWPALLKPDQGGSGARIQVVESLAQVEAIFAADPASGCRTTCSCSRNSCRTIPSRASSGWSSSAASCSTRCG